MSQNVPQKLLTARVSEAVELAKARMLPDASASSQSAQACVDSLPLVFACSEYVRDISQRYPDWLPQLFQQGHLDAGAKVPTVDALRLSILQQYAQQGAQVPLDEDVCMQSLRLTRHREMLRILWRDITRTASLDDTLTHLSNLADACIAVASEWAHQSIEIRFGRALDETDTPQSLVILGMGKLGGRELNVSSDIDLIYWFRQSGFSDGQRKLDASEYFRRVAQLVTRLLGSVTGDGFVFRVDTRLRPFGESGPLVMNFDGVEQYYLTQGRDWERYAMVKARPIVGEQSDLDALNQLLQPFVYRRYLDYSAIDSLRELKRKIAISVRQKNRHNNIKLGSGGIREVEFIGQAFQLVRGGRQMRLRERPIKTILTTIADMKLMPEKTVYELCDAYDFLRKTENALQAMRDQQVHTLPDSIEDQLRLVCMMRFESWEQFQSVLQEKRTLVAHHFNQLFSDWDADGSLQHTDADVASASAAVVAWAVLSSPETENDAALAVVESLGMHASEPLLESLASLTRGGFYQRLTAQSQSRVDQILPLLLEAALLQETPEDTLLRCLELVRKVAGRSGYLQILVERPPALDRLVNIFAKSAWVATFVSRHPIVIDELLRDNSDEPLPTREQLEQEALHEAGRLAELELDEQMDAMRQFKQARELHIAKAELTENLPLMKVSDQLTWLAESVVKAVLLLVQKPLIERFGHPGFVEEGIQHEAEVGVVAYGKLGGIELGYGSDLDLVFLHNSRGQKQYTDGEKSVDNGLFYARLAQKVVSFMSTQTPAGVLYEIDLRLRPNGQSGVLVTQIDAYQRYQLDEAWTWEHQAIVRARMILGSDSLSAQFEKVRDTVLSREREIAELAEEVSSMRQKMRDNLGSAKPDRVHLKQDAGGIADIEFMVQFLVLAYAHQQPQLLRFSDNIRLLEAAQQCHLLSTEQSETLQETYLLYRGMLHRQSLQLQGADVELDPLVTEPMAKVVSLWNQLFDSASVTPHRNPES